MRRALSVFLLLCLAAGAAQAGQDSSQPSISRAKADEIYQSIMAKHAGEVQPGGYILVPESEIPPGFTDDTFLFGPSAQKGGDPTIQGAYWWFFSNFRACGGNLFVQSATVYRGFLSWTWNFNVNIPPGFAAFYIVPGPNWLATWMRVRYQPQFFKPINQLLWANFGPGWFGWFWKCIVWFPPPGPPTVFVFGPFSDYCDAEFDTTGSCAGVSGTPPDSVQETVTPNQTPATDIFGLVALSATLLFAGAWLLMRRRSSAMS